MKNFLPKGLLFVGISLLFLLTTGEIFYFLINNVSFSLISFLFFIYITLIFLIINIFKNLKK